MLRTGRSVNPRLEEGASVFRPGAARRWRISCPRRFQIEVVNHFVQDYLGLDDLQLGLQEIGIVRSERGACVGFLRSLAGSLSYDDASGAGVGLGQDERDERARGDHEQKHGDEYRDEDEQRRRPRT